MTDADQPAKNDLVSIKGWLLCYVIGPGILGTLWGVTDAIIWGVSGHPAYRLIFSVLITANLIGLYLIFGVRKSITQIYHIWLNFNWAGFWAFTAVESGGPQGWGAVSALLIWALYWIGSKRVGATYRQNAA